MTMNWSSEVVASPLPDAQADVAPDPLPSWNDGPAKQSILHFVEEVTREGSPAFVPVAERIATFDNDGTLWCEQPAPVQAYFALDRVKALASQHPEWKTQEPYASLLKGDLRATLAGGDHALLEIVMATHAGINDDFIRDCREKITEGTSALFLMTSDATKDKVIDAMKQHTFEIITTNLSKEQEDALRAAFKEEDESAAA